MGGFIRKLLVGIGLTAILATLGYLLYQEVRAESLCEICRRPVHEQTSYRLFLESGEVEDVCCPRCGLRYQKDRHDVVRAEVADFGTGERLDARDAFFVENNTVAFCCQRHMREDRSGMQVQLSWDRCLPGLVGFKYRQAAEAFRQETGGRVRTYDQLLAEEP